MIAAFSVSPAGTEEVGAAVAEAVRLVRESGLPNETNAMFTNVEGEWDEVMALIESCVLRLAEDSGRVSAVIKLDYRPGVTGALRGKVETSNATWPSHGPSRPAATLAGRFSSPPTRAPAGRELGARVELGSLGVFQCPACRRLGHMFLGLAELLEKRSSRVLDQPIDHCLIGRRRFAESLLGGSSLVGKVHHGPVMIRRGPGGQVPRPWPEAVIGGR